MSGFNLNLMRREMLVGMLVILSLIGSGQGRLPQVNDTVGISFNSGYGSRVVLGNITEITDDFIGLNVTESVVEFANGQETQQETYTPPLPICIGVGSITTILWDEEN